MQDGLLAASIAEFVFHPSDVRGLREEEDSEDRMLRCSELRESEKVQLQPSAILFYCTGLVVLLVLRNTSVAYGRDTGGGYLLGFCSKTRQCFVCGLNGSTGL